MHIIFCFLLLRSWVRCVVIVSLIWKMCIRGCNSSKKAECQVIMNKNNSNLWLYDHMSRTICCGGSPIKCESYGYEAGISMGSVIPSCMKTSKCRKFPLLRQQHKALGALYNFSVDPDTWWRYEWCFLIINCHNRWDIYECFSILKHKDN